MSTQFYIEPADGDSYFAADVIAGAAGIIQIFKLPDGRYATSGLVWDIDDGSDCYGKRVIFSSREQALRAAVARFVRVCRKAKRRGSYQGITGSRADELVKWAEGLIRRRTGLALFDWGIE